MSDSKFPTKEQYKELDELMVYILDEMWGTDDKKLIREGIIAYANKWREILANDVNSVALPSDEDVKNAIIKQTEDIGYKVSK